VGRSKKPPELGDALLKSGEVGFFHGSFLEGDAARDKGKGTRRIRNQHGNELG
jgi:hypothetical protein